MVVLWSFLMAACLCLLSGKLDSRTADEITKAWSFWKKKVTMNRLVQRTKKFERRAHAKHINIVYVVNVGS
jgi:hypothetical protein